MKAQKDVMLPNKERSPEWLVFQIENQRREIEKLKQEKADLEIVLETVNSHADNIQAELFRANDKLEAEVAEKRRAEAKLESVLGIVSQEKADLEILLETIAEHNDVLTDLLEEKLKDTVEQSEIRLAQFLEAIPVGVFVVDSTGKPYYANRTAKQILGKGIVWDKQVEELREVYQAYLAGTDEIYPRDRDVLLLALQGQSMSLDDMEIRQENQVIPIEVRGTPIYDESGEIIYAIAVFQDITVRKQAEAERIKFTEQLMQLNKANERFVPSQFLQLLNKKSIVDIQVGDQVEKKMSILFADIRGFTRLSEGMTPEDNFKFINAYLSRMEPAIMENRGFIDKYIGDGLMALFNGNADDAVNAAIAMMQKLTEYNTTRDRPQREPLKIGIGINTGLLMLGTVGGKSRLDSTVIGDTVNLASRLETLTKEYSVSVLISHHTFASLTTPEKYNLRFVDSVQVKGKSETVTIFEVFDADPPEIKEGKLITKTVFEEAICLFFQGKLEEARQGFTNCLQLNPDDTVAQIYLERCQ
ncbi:MAG: adenylate/guanylate cyclase domain-containing protein [Oscillatoria sp. PMC 1068.18]|nr:adenylate/guanylate cyclase domain-containing protein [Oscillatoria sp. PMC 1076.18]MEC4990060.1 adenylate/guanylate cyclase domain-containing protein [Oscillatoria sp. PMC 1068.18]